jgi:putative ABC transport system ATP-binding protein
VEYIKQEDLKDCGLTVLQMLVKQHHNYALNINTLKSKASYGKNGISISNLINLGSEFGLSLEAFEVELVDLCKANYQDNFVTLVKVNNQLHYVIVTSIKKMVTYYDPMIGKVKISKEEFVKIFQKYLITVKKTIFNYKKFNLKEVSKYITNYKHIYP